MISTFLMKYIKNGIESGLKKGIRQAGHQIVGGYQAKKEQLKLEEALLELERNYTGTVIDTNDFQQYYSAHDLTRRIQDYIRHTQSMVQSEQAFLNSLVDEYEQSRRSFVDKTAVSGHRKLIYEFLEKITHLCRQMEYEKAEDDSRAISENQTQHLLTIEERLVRMQDILPSPTSQQAEKSKSAVIFQKKFHKRLFLEKEGGAELAQVYVHPKCKVENRKREMGASRGGSAEDIFDTINEFLRSSKDILVIEGIAGSGKSSLLAALSDCCNSPEYLYIALKDLLKEKKVLDFKWNLLEACGLDRNDSDRILLLDGYDEIGRYLSADEFREDLQWLCERGHKIILTTRPGYLAEAGYSAVNWERAEMQPFDEAQIEEWLARYRRINQEMKQETVDALMEPPSEQRLDAIRRIPIMLYVIANRDIDVHSVSSMGDLYERVFENLKRDKAGMTAAVLELHYSIAQRMAYHMYAQNELQITAESVEAISGESFDKTFYSSVYTENSIIEGKFILEFVHKSILEFFAAKWIYRNLAEEEGIFSVLRSTYISEEILEYLQYFYQKEQETGSATATGRHIQNSFRCFLEKGVPHGKGWISAETMEAENSCLFYNFAVLQKEMMGMKQFLSGDFIRDQGKTLTFIIRTYLLAGRARPLLFRRIFENENLSPLYAPSYLDFEGMDLSGIAWEQSILRHVSFKENEMSRIIFRSLRIEKCDFDQAVLKDSQLDKVTFDEASFKNLRMSHVVLMNMKMPRGRLQMTQLHNSFLQNVRFEYNNLVKVNFSFTEFQQVFFRKMNFKQCKFNDAVLENVIFSDTNFTRCDFTDVVDRGRCVFERCRIDEVTRQTNPALFEMNGAGDGAEKGQT